MTETEIIEEPVVISGEWDLVGFESEHIQHVYVNDSLVYISKSNEVYKSPISDQANWEFYNFGPDLDDSVSVADFEVFSGSEVLLAIRDSNYVARTFRTHNGGESWEELYNELNENEVRVSDLVFDPVNDKMYLLFSGHVLESVDRGSSWVPIYWSERYNDDKWVAPGPSINKFALNSYDSKEIWGIGYGVTGQGVMIRSMDSGKNWTHYNLDTGVVGGGPLRDVSFSKTNGKAMVGFLGGIFTITDPNGDWELVYDSLGTLVLENGNVTDNTVYASGRTFGIENHGKLFITFTPDFGMNWQRFYYQSAFSEALEVNEMAVARVNNKETVLLATTKGLYSFTVTVIEPVE